MANRALVGAVGVLIGVSWALPGHAQMRTSRPMTVTTVTTQPVAGPTRLFIVPRADLLPLGTSVTSANIQVNTVAPAQVVPGVGVPAPTAAGVGLGFGYAGNALSLTNQSSMGLFQLDTGITAYATAPWQGRVDVAGKMGLINAIPLSIAGLAGVALNLDANGTPSLGFNLGVPITGTLGITPANRFTLTAFPNWGTGLVAPGTIGAGIMPATRFALGLGGALTLTDAIALMADTSMLATTPGVPIEGSNLGIRFGLNPAVTLDLYAGLGANQAVGSTPINIGAGINWQY